MKILIFFSLLISIAQASTLQELARVSNAVLVVSDHLSSGKPAPKACGLELEQISEVSQNLKMQIDSKMASLKKSDFKLIQSRSKSCEKDCTCDIYALALEKSGLIDEVLQHKAMGISSEQREKCMQQIKNVCQKIKALK